MRLQCLLQIGGHDVIEAAFAGPSDPSFGINENHHVLFALESGR